MMSVDQETAPTDADWRARVRGSRLGNLAVLGVTALAVLLGVWLVMRPGVAATDGANEAGSGDVSQVEVRGLAAAPRVGDPAPAFVATALDGSEVSLDALRGRPVWLVFVATWCSGCRAEMPDVQAAHEAAGVAGVQVVAIYVGERPSEVAPYVDRLGLTFSQLPDPQTKLAASYGVMGVPAHFFIDADGVLRQTRVGILSPHQMTEAISQTGA